MWYVVMTYTLNPESSAEITSGPGQRSCGML